MALNNYPYEISHRNIKYPRLELKTGKPVFILPFGYDPDRFYKEHENWISKKINFVEECLNNGKNKKLIERTDECLKKLVYEMTEKISLDLRVKINKTYFRKMQTKWASLSPLKNLTINMLIKYLPQYLIEYIIFHELVHVIEKKHNARFWKMVEKRYKFYKNLEKELFEYWFKVLYK